ncbi:hypothetical protein IFM89_022264 [Coptis chinensis]|uniref:Uncharacterized protein n=1 Tax=Coptis chinensis TaxID=261450 RepID=A0A835HGU9_9MAGN|nr:hypothetical protein IFM89_022264 [Coptis chinensis]
MYDPSFLVRSISSKSASKKSFTVTYLVGACGLSQVDAISASKKVQFKNSTGPNSVLALLRSHGFRDIHIAQIIQKTPKLLICNAEKTLKPKIEFFRSFGLSGPDLADIVYADPYIFEASLEKQIIPTIVYLKAVLHLTNSDVMSLLTRSPSLFNRKPHYDLPPDMSFLLKERSNSIGREMTWGRQQTFNTTINIVQGVRLWFLPGVLEIPIMLTPEPGADVDLKNDGGHSALHYAASKG